MAGASAVGAVAGGGGSGPDALENASLMASLSPDELREIREYAKLLRFRDEVIAGSHPRIKPSHLSGKAAQGQKPPSAPVGTTASQPAAAKRAVVSDRSVIDSSQSRQTNKQQAQLAVASDVPGLGTLSGTSSNAQAAASGKPEINPVLLKKSDDLIKAEIQLQRQRVERSLKEELEQRRGATKASEQLAELDVADILAKAMSMALASPHPQSTDDTAANVSASNDSADDDTFYSSRHDTPESNMVSRLPNESEDEEMREGSPYEPELDFDPVVPQAQPATTSAPVGPSAAPSQAQQPSNPPMPVPAAASTVGETVPGLSVGTGTSSTRVSAPQAPDATNAGQGNSGGRLEESGKAESSQLSRSYDLSRVNEQSLGQAAIREPPLVRGHDLSPLAPQPTHVLPPAIAKEPQPSAPEPNHGPQAAPAQVAALRKQPSNGSSPESSPHSSKAAEKKKNKKKKRKADRLAADTAAASPYIKPEPRSPSPLTPQLSRPSKRQRYSQQQPVEIRDDEPRYEQPMPVEEGYQERYQPRVVRQERVVGYERADGYRALRDEEPILVTSPRYERVYYDDYRAPPPPPSHGYPAGPEPAQYVSREVRTVRPPARVAEGPYEDGTTYYRDVRAASRTSVRVPAYPERSQSPTGYERPPAAMPPPRPAPRRIYVDAFGREYLEPVRSATVIREEVADSRGSYERPLPPRAVSRRPEPLDDEAVFYHPTSPTYAAPRRVITQPEYSYRETAGPSNALALPPADYPPARQEPPREYMARSASVRAPVDPVRYDVPTAYERVPPPVDRQAPAREFYRAGSLRPAAGPSAAEGHSYPRYEAPSSYEVPPPGRDYPPPPVRSASVRPPPPGDPADGRYEPPMDYTASSSGRRLEYAHPAGYSQYQQDGRRETMPPPPPARAYSVAPGDAPGQAVRREYHPGAQHPVERYYGPPGRGREDEEVVFVERGPPVVTEGYR
ncbi:uncharacterized protein P884DRAFT_260133 [Thermothelomyces heterothallicus CBS 202.75]|uniref:uncharacterized protein n=1 Tax=Thermothelomyces heterothallicus CBS 202.75 TaxID=1149848 RepID=UPI0037421098